MRARPDAYWYAPHPRLCTFAPNAVAQLLMTTGRNSLGFIDQHFVLPRAVADDVMLRMISQFQQCSATWPHPDLEHWLLHSLETSTRGLGTHVTRTRFPFAIVRNDSHEQSAKDFCRTPGYAVSKPQCMQRAYPESVQRAKSTGASDTLYHDRLLRADAPTCNAALREATSNMWVSGGCRGTFVCNGHRTGLCGASASAVRHGSTRRVLCSCAENATKRSLLNPLLNQHSAFIGSQATSATVQAGRACNVSLLQPVSAAAPCTLGYNFGCVESITVAAASAACFAVELASSSQKWL